MERWVARGFAFGNNTSTLDPALDSINDEPMPA
jgi:hypothetical protein